MCTITVSSCEGGHEGHEVATVATAHVRSWEPVVVLPMRSPHMIYRYSQDLNSFEVYFRCMIL